MMGYMYYSIYKYSFYIKLIQAISRYFIGKWYKRHLFVDMLNELQKRLKKLIFIFFICSCMVHSLNVNILVFRHSADLLTCIYYSVVEIWIDCKNFGILSILSIRQYTLSSMPLWYPTFFALTSISLYLFFSCAVL
jgi:hypothetical protein